MTRYSQNYHAKPLSFPPKTPKTKVLAHYGRMLCLAIVRENFGFFGFWGKTQWFCMVILRISCHLWVFWENTCFCLGSCISLVQVMGNLDLRRYALTTCPEQGQCKVGPQKTYEWIAAMHANDTPQEKKTWRGCHALESRYTLQSIRALSLEGAEGIIPIYIEYIYTNIWISFEGREDPISDFFHSQIFDL